MSSSETSAVSSSTPNNSNSQSPTQVITSTPAASGQQQPSPEENVVSIGPAPERLLRAAIEEMMGPDVEEEVGLRPAASQVNVEDDEGSVSGDVGVAEVVGGSDSGEELYDEDYVYVPQSPIPDNMLYRVIRY